MQTLKEIVRMFSSHAHFALFWKEGFKDDCGNIVHIIRYWRRRWNALVCKCQDLVFIIIGVANIFSYHLSLVEF